MAPWVAAALATALCPVPAAETGHPIGIVSHIKVTYIWEEGGLEKRDVHLAQGPQETYPITCATKPKMKSIVLER